MSNTTGTDTKKDSLDERDEAATDSRTLDEISKEEKTSSPADSEMLSPDSPVRDREANKDAGDPM